MAKPVRKAAAPRKLDHRDYPIRESIGHLITVTNRMLQPVLEQKVRDQGVTYGTWFFLRVLWEKDGISQGELSKRVATSAPTTIAALNKMKAGGLVAVRDDPQDGRRLIVSLTAKGRRLEGVLLPRLAELNTDLMQGLKKGEIAELRRMLRVIQGNAEKGLVVDRKGLRPDGLST
jgi:DNA-binding MarR family transcriptional regulator